MSKMALEPFGELELGFSCEEWWWEDREGEFWEDVLKFGEPEGCRDTAAVVVYLGLAVRGWAAELGGCPLRAPA